MCIHLQYLFAGTGAGAKEEHISLLADIKRVRPGDTVVFYLQGVGFYGVFRVADSSPLVFRDSTYLRRELGKKLIYRVFIELDTLYPNYVTEWEALEKLPVYAQEVIWSLIYRKLKGNRGCTPITIEESQRLLKMLQDKSNNKPLQVASSDALTWEANSQEIQILPGKRDSFTYQGPRNQTEDVLQQILVRAQAKRAYEAHLQAYFMESIGIEPQLRKVCHPGGEVIWVGNEVACGVGMQKIDIFIITSDKRENKEYRVIELIDEPVTPAIVHQLRRYVDWTCSYIKGAINSNVQPVVVAPQIEKESLRYASKWADIARASHHFNSEHIAKEVQYFEFDMSGGTIVFNEIRY